MNKIIFYHLLNEYHIDGGASSQSKNYHLMTEFTFFFFFLEINYKVSHRESQRHKFQIPWEKNT